MAKKNKPTPEEIETIALADAKAAGGNKFFRVESSEKTVCILHIGQGLRLFPKTPIFVNDTVMEKLQGEVGFQKMTKCKPKLVIVTEVEN